MFRGLFVLAVLVGGILPQIEEDIEPRQINVTIAYEPTTFEKAQMMEEKHQERKQEILEQEYLETKRLEQEALELQEREAQMQEVNFTSFNDPTVAYGGKSPRGFATNKYGMAVDQDGYVVLGTATNLCLEVKSGACGRYNSLPSGYSVFNLGDEVEFVIDKFVDGNGNPVPFKGKVYDSCGACFWAETRQRVDVFMNSGSLGKIKGKMTRSN